MGGGRLTLGIEAFAGLQQFANAEAENPFVHVKCMWGWRDGRATCEIYAHMLNAFKAGAKRTVDAVDEVESPTEALRLSARWSKFMENQAKRAYISESGKENKK